MSGNHFLSCSKRIVQILLIYIIVFVSFFVLHLSHCGLLLVSRQRRSKANTASRSRFQLVQNSEKGKQPLLFVRRTYCPLEDGWEQRSRILDASRDISSGICNGRFINKDVQSGCTNSDFYVTIYIFSLSNYFRTIFIDINMCKPIFIKK